VHQPLDIWLSVAATRSRVMTPGSLLVRTIPVPHYGRMVQEPRREGRRWASSRWRRLAALAIVLLAGVVLTVLLMAVVLSPVVIGEPPRWLQCAWEGRNGWFVEHPPSSVSERAFRRTVRDQTACVDLTVRRVNTGTVPDGFVVGPVGGRTWVSRRGSIEVLVEAEPGPGVIECGEALREPGPGQLTEVLSCPAEIEFPPSE